MTRIHPGMWRSRGGFAGAAQIVRSTGHHSADCHSGVCSFCLVEVLGKPAGLLPKPPELRSKDVRFPSVCTLGVTREGKNAFYFNGHPNAPTLRWSPGDQLKITYVTIFRLSRRRVAWLVRAWT